MMLKLALLSVHALFDDVLTVALFVCSLLFLNDCLLLNLCCCLSWPGLF
jgi:hypothetical protein